MKRLGQLLLDRGWISPEQLTRALAQQRLVGGRLGTCLLETKGLDERQLLRALSEQLHVPFADVEELRAVSPDVLSMLPAKVARRCRAVPFRHLGGQLSLAMLNVRDLALQDELGFVTGKRLRVHVAHEARLFEALERYYGEECPRRLAQLVDQLNRARFLWQQEGEGAAGTVEGPASSPAWSLPSDSAPSPGLAPSLPMPRAPEPPAPAPAREDAPEPLLAAVPPVAALDLAPQPAPLPDRAEPVSQEAPGQPPDRDAIGRDLVARLDPEFHRVVLLAVRGKRLAGWIGTGSDLSHGALAELTLEPEASSILTTVRDGAPLFRGPLPSLPSHHSLAAIWGGKLPRDCVLLPLPVGGKTAALLYLDREPVGLGTLDPSTLRELLAETGEQLALCIRRRKADARAEARR
ncbi:MAG TPA: hypothetical protein VLA75_11900 [Thermoanaerobaculia bacterium]|nr:hypothetical protein [Thermoanaerobaculia bacterium]